MNIFRQTLSLCPKCYLEIPATIEVKPDGVKMNKKCPAHGSFDSVVEEDPLFYIHTANLRAANIYPSHFVDITRTCNLRCEPCFYALEKADPAGMFSIGNIVNECMVNINRAPFVLTGGEPTLHPQITEIISEVSAIGPVEMLSNGVKLADREFFDSIHPLLTDKAGTCHIHLSIHDKETSKWRQVVNHARESKLNLASALIVIKDESEFMAALDLCELLRDCVKTFRIKAASNLWNTKDVKNKVFVSQMLKWMEATKTPVQHVLHEHNKSCFYNVVYNGMHIMLVSWFDVTNVDLVDINCAPTYRARNGEVVNLVTANLINEGIESGWLKGRKTFDQVFKQASP